MAAATPSGDVFSEHRRLLFGVAYRMLGSVADAEDIVQDAWLRWSEVDADGKVENPRAYLIRTVTNLSLNRLRSAQVRRESYVGPWLPEPLLTSPDVAEEAEMAETLSMAMLVVLETLSPLERAVFMLREVFGYSYAEIADTLDRQEATIRQTAHRAREHVRARRPRFDADSEQREQVTELFRAACEGGDLNGMMELLAPDVTLWSDGGGKVTAARRPLHGADHVARWLLGTLNKPVSAGVVLEVVELNGQPGIVARFGPGGPFAGAMLLEVAAGGQVSGVRMVVNPDKFGGLEPRG
jgi:RNA polymerase sigma-70 factor (TIGR02957 family)